MAITKIRILEISEIYGLQLEHFWANYKQSKI